ncbi:MAG TPA: penicillin acylase family protein [Bacteroidota bacterium]|nr:penicillin acylase family protein [Bacteroidota bacterium]
MQPRARILIGLTFFIIIFLIAAAGVGYYLITRSFPKTSGTISMQGLHAEVRIYRDDHGVPHVEAQREADGYFAVGFLHAQDRLWQMELARRAGMGRLAEVLGDSALKFDRMFRTLGVWRQAQRIAAQLDGPTRTAIEAYAKGVNACIQESEGAYPVEFDLLGIRPEPWTVEHTIVIARLMAWELNYSRWVDIVLGEIVRRFGVRKGGEVFPQWPKEVPPIVSALGQQPLLPLAEEFLNTEKDFRRLLGGSGVTGGSNSWVVSGKKTVSGKPLLANDPHLMFFLPGRWYELHLSTPEFEVQGTSIAGVPFVVIGRNRFIAWGLTNGMVDDHDYFVEEVDSLQHPTHYRFNGQWLPLQQRIDTILVKDNVPVLLTTYHTHRGPIINRIEPSAVLSSSLLSIRWVGHEITNEAKTFYLLQRAQNWHEFREALRYFSVPAQNFVYADVEGNIGYRLGGAIPIRRTTGPTLPAPGWNDEYDWKGFVPFDMMPEEFNPPSGFIATANNKIIDDSYPYYITDLWEPHWRVARITELLAGGDKFSVEDMQRIQLDVQSIHARELVPLILAAFPDSLVSDQRVRTTLTYFRNWAFEMTRDDVATTLFQAFCTNVVKRVLEDELGETILYYYQEVPAIPLRVVSRMLHEGTSEWLDDVSTEHRESRDEIIRQALENAIKQLQTDLGGELKEWRWGRLHTVEFQHTFGANDLLRGIFNVGPIPIGGSHSTVNKGDYELNAPFVNTVGPSTRQIYDLADPTNTRAVSPPGQSGQVFHKHFDDQMVLWLGGGYRSFPMSLDAVKSRDHDLLILEPVR